MEKADKNSYSSPKIVEHYPFKFENAISSNTDPISGGGSFPGTGNGVGGTPGQVPGTFPGGGNTGGVFPGKGNGKGRGNNRP